MHKVDTQKEKKTEKKNRDEFLLGIHDFGRGPCADI